MARDSPRFPAQSCQLLVMSLDPKTIGQTHLADRALTMLQCNSLLSHLLAISRKLSFSSRVEYAGCLENDNAFARPHRPCCGLLARPLVGSSGPSVITIPIRDCPVNVAPGEEVIVRER